MNDAGLATADQPVFKKPINCVVPENATTALAIRMNVISRMRIVSFVSRRQAGLDYCSRLALPGRWRHGDRAPWLPQWDKGAGTRVVTGYRRRRLQTSLCSPSL